MKRKLGLALIELLLIFSLIQEKDNERQKLSHDLLNK